MTNNISYTVEEIAQILKVSKLTVYDLVKKGNLPAYRVGRQMRVDADDLNNYKRDAKTDSQKRSSSGEPSTKENDSSIRSIVISGQDISLDILASHIGKQTTEFRPLRSYMGSLNSLISMYRGEVEIVSTHLFDGDTGEYNTPYVQKILTGRPYTIINLVNRWAGFYVQRGNPKNIRTWSDLATPKIKIINREKGSGARVLLDEQLRIHNIPATNISGYEIEESTHLAVAGMVSKKEVDVGIGIEKAALIVGVDFIPLIKEQYNLVILKYPTNSGLIETILNILRSSSFQSELQAIGSYDISQTGTVVFETP